MIPEAGDFLIQAGEDLRDALKVAALPLPKLAARCAYYAAFHAAEAFIYARSNKVAKTHSGVRAEFSRLLKKESPTNLDLSTTLARLYEFKEISDYGPAGDTITESQAQAALVSASLFVERVKGLIEG